MNSQQPISHGKGAYNIMPASGETAHGRDEPPTSSTEDMSEQSQDSLTMEGAMSGDMSHAVLSGGAPANVKGQYGIPSVLSQHIANGSGDANGEDTKREHKKRSKNWIRAETLSLIRARRELDDKFRRSGKKAALWDEISCAVQRAGFSRDGQQCKDKWEKLTASYKEVRDGAREKEHNPYFEELHPLLSWKVCKKESETMADVLDANKRVKFELANDYGVPSWKYVGGTMPGAMDDVAREKVDYDRESGGSSPGKRKRLESMSFTDLHVIQELLETIISRQQRFFKDLLDAVDRKEQLRDQMRHEREEKWRAEERAQRFAFNKAMILLTDRLLGERRPPGAVIVPAPPVTTPPIVGGGGALFNIKKRSKNWKKSEVFNLIRLRRDMESRFAMSTRRAAFWDELGEKLGALGITRDGKQCREKWDKLMAEYKDVLDGKKEREESPYFAELSTFLGKANEVDGKDEQM